MTIIQCRPHRQNLVLAFILLCQACATPDVKHAGSFDTNKVTLMTFALTSDSLLGHALPVTSINTAVEKNLAQWGYSFAEQNRSEASHLLTASLGTVKSGASPVGFSFSAGNSDPRALDFQKSEVLPIVCSLASKAQTDMSAELTLEVMTEDYQHNAGQADGQEQLNAQLIDDISTACFNLLSELKIQQQPLNDNAASKDSHWFPSIRIETEQVPQHPPAAPAQAAPSLKPNEDPVNNLDDTQEKATVPPSPRLQIEETTEPQQQGSSRKRIIIHNQGNPIIFQFGHERK